MNPATSPHKISVSSQLILLIIVLLSIITGCTRFDQKLLSDQPHIRLDAQRKLIKANKMTKQKILPWMIIALENEDKSVRDRAVASFSLIGSDAVPSLIEALASDMPHKRASAAESLSMIGPGAKSAVEALLALQNDTDKDVHMWAIMALNKINPAEFGNDHSFLRFIQKDKAPEGKKRKKVIPTSQDDVQALILDLRSTNNTVRYHAIINLLQKGPTAIPSLFQALTHTDPRIREGAAKVMKYITLAEEDAIPLVIRFLKKGNPQLTQISDTILKGLPPSGDKTIRALIKAVEHKELCIRLEAIRALGEIGVEAKTALPVLKKALQDDDPFIRKAVISAFREIEYKPPQIDRVLLEKALIKTWKNMLYALSSGNMTKSLQHFSAKKRKNYRTTFQSIGDRLPELANNLSGDYKLRDIFGTTFATLYGKVFIEGVQQGVHVQFVLDDDGVWRIQSF